MKKLNGTLAAPTSRLSALIVVSLGIHAAALVAYEPTPIRVAAGSTRTLSVELYQPKQTERAPAVPSQTIVKKKVVPKVKQEVAIQVKEEVAMQVAEPPPVSEPPALPVAESNEIIVAQATQLTLDALDEYFYYPLKARRKGWQGDVVLDVELLTNGVVGHVSVAKSSGHSTLDAAAMKSMRSVGMIALLTLPNSLRLQVPVSYRLIN